MIWANQLGGLSALNWACICLFALNILVLPFVFFTTEGSRLESEDIFYPTLTLFSSNRNSDISPLELTEIYPPVEDIGEVTLAIQNLIVASESKQASKPTTRKSHENSSKHSIVVGDAKLRRKCYKIGPLTSNEERIKWQNLLETRGMFASVAYDQLEEDLGYWVFIPPLRSRALGRLKVEELKLKGFHEAVLLDRNEPINAVSLGVYETQKDAHKLLLKAQSLGFSVKLDVRSQSIDSVWLIAESGRQQRLDSPNWASFLKSAPHLSSRTIDCT